MRFSPRSLRHCVPAWSKSTQGISSCRCAGPRDALPSGEGVALWQWSRNGEQQRPRHPLNASDLQSMRLENSNDVLLGMSDDDRVGTVSLLADKIYKLSVVFLAAVSAE